MIMQLSNWMYIFQDSDIPSTGPLLTYHPWLDLHFFRPVAKYLKGSLSFKIRKMVISKSKNLDSNQISNHLTFACPAVCKTSGILLFFWKIDVYNLQACSLWNSFALFCPFSSSVSYFDWSPPFSPTFCPWLLSTKAQRPLVFSPVRTTRKAKQLQFCVPL